MIGRTSLFTAFSSNWLEINITNLLNPSDAQDVPRAIKLLLSIVRISELYSDNFDPSEAAEFEALCVLGETLDTLLQPFINTELSLSEQIESLIKCSHLLCALYIQNGTSFMPTQLYADIQAMIPPPLCIVYPNIISKRNKEKLKEVPCSCTYEEGQRRPSTHERQPICR